MNPTAQSAHAPARLETKSVAAPAVGADPVASIAGRIDAQTNAIVAGQRGIEGRITVLEAKQAMAERRQRAINEERAAAEEEERAAKAGRPDPLIGEKKRAIGRSIDDYEGEIAKLRADNERLQRKSARPMGPTGRGAGTGYSSKSAAFALYRKASLDYLRYGQTEFSGVQLRDLERKALHGETGGDGGFLIHPEHDTGPLERLLLEYVPMRQHATVRTIAAASFKKPVSTGGASASWVGERETRSETASPDLVELEFPAHELYAKPKASQQLIEDAAIDIEGWLSEEVVEAFAVAEATAFISGTGIKQPVGLLHTGHTYIDEASTAWSWGSVGYIKTGVNGGFAAASSSVNQGDKLWTLTSQLRGPYRQNAAFMGNRRTKGVCRTLKDGTGQWIWADARDGNPESLCGYPFIEAEQMPDIATNSYSLAFGDYRKAYMIVDRVGMSVLRDPYSAKPFIEFYTRKRVGGGVQNFEAYKLLKFAA